MVLDERSLFLVVGNLTSTEGTISQAITAALPPHSGLPCKQVKPCEHLSTMQSSQAHTLQSSVYHLRGSSAGVATTRFHCTGMQRELPWPHWGDRESYEEGGDLGRGQGGSTDTSQEDRTRLGQEIQGICMSQSPPKCSRESWNTGSSDSKEGRGSQRPVGLQTSFLGSCYQY